ncbi:hypothetical protein [Desulfosporosinus shakirovi]|uniref:hypothetical protein n=1 Tax=Desulfosporosinus shakirovi TaxID=2885154 RepID=UPI001E36511A|nr:hypothetical protein [Desulfosporosinus sp. SRJS8]MCB8817947.1 hypothetical protein [Desulfosporosinus sp. SRJS8]
MRKKTLILIGAILIIAVLISLILSLRGSVKTIKHGYFPIQSYATIKTSYKSSQYDIDDYTITFSVPDATEIYVSSDMGNEMQFSTYLVNNNELAFRGYIQLWKIKDLERFLSYSKSLSPFDFRSYKVRDVLKSEYQGFIIEWTAEFGQESISGKEYWLKINSTDEVVRISILSDTVEFPNKLDNVIQQISDSLQIDVKYFI